MTHIRLRIGPWTCTLLAAAGIAVLVAGGGFLIDDNGLSRRCMEHTESKLSMKLQWPVDTPTLGLLLERVRAETGLTIEANWDQLRRRGMTPHTPCAPAFVMTVGDLLAYHFPIADVPAGDRPAWTYARRALSIDRFGTLRMGESPALIERRYDLSFVLGRMPLTAEQAQALFASEMTSQRFEAVQQHVTAKNLLMSLSFDFQCDHDGIGPTLSALHGIATVRATLDHHRFIRKQIETKLGGVPQNHLEALWRD